MVVDCGRCGGMIALCPGAGGGGSKWTNSKRRSYKPCGRNWVKSFCKIQRTNGKHDEMHFDLTGAGRRKIWNGILFADMPIHEILINSKSTDAKASYNYCHLTN